MQKRNQTFVIVTDGKVRAMHLWAAADCDFLKTGFADNV